LFGGEGGPVDGFEEGVIFELSGVACCAQSVFWVSVKELSKEGRRRRWIKAVWQSVSHESGLLRSEDLLL
jgi:hypothetical protein